MKSDYKYSWQYKEIVARLFTRRLSSAPDCSVGASDYYRKEWDIILKQLKQSGTCSWHDPKPVRAGNNLCFHCSALHNTILHKKHCVGTYKESGGCV